MRSFVEIKIPQEKHPLAEVAAVFMKTLFKSHLDVFFQNKHLAYLSLSGLYYIVTWYIFLREETQFWK